MRATPNEDGWGAPCHQRAKQFVLLAVWKESVVPLGGEAEGGGEAGEGVYLWILWNWLAQRLPQRGMHWQLVPPVGQAVVLLAV